MNLFKLKNPSASPPQPPQATHQQLPPLPPPIAALQQAFTSLQTQFTGFLQNHLPPPAFPPATSPLWAKIPNPNSNPSFPYDFTSGKRSKGLAMSWEAIGERLAGIPVYALSRSSSEEFVVISGANSGNHLGMFCFNEADAEAILQELKSLDPSMSDGCQVLPVALSKVFPLKVDGVAFRLIPEASQVKKAISERKKVCTTAKDFPGIPVFQSKSLALRSEQKRYRPVFFRMEDLEKSLERASSEQRTLKPSLRRGDIQVASLEEIVKGMKDDSSSTWDDVVFVPPGFDVSASPTGQ